MLVSADCIGNNARVILAFKKEECPCGSSSHQDNIYCADACGNHKRKLVVIS
jgi:hypothetical protein